MSLPNPSPEVVQAIESAVVWFQSAKLSGIEQVWQPDTNSPTGKNKVVLNNPAAPPLWARFYEIGTNRPIYSDRDGVRAASYRRSRTSDATVTPGWSIPRPSCSSATIRRGKKSLPSQRTAPALAACIRMRVGLGFFARLAGLLSLIRTWPSGRRIAFGRHVTAKAVAGDNQRQNLSDCPHRALGFLARNDLAARRKLDPLHDHGDVLQVGFWKDRRMVYKCQL